MGQGRPKVEDAGRLCVMIPGLSKVNVSRVVPFKLIWLFAGPFCHRALLTLEEKQLKYTSDYVDFADKPKWYVPATLTPCTGKLFWRNTAFVTIQAA